MSFLGSHLGEEFAEMFGFWNVVGEAHQVSNGAFLLYLTLCLSHENVLYGDDPDDVIDTFIVDGKAGMRELHVNGKKLLQVKVPLHPRHVLMRSHYLAHVAVSELKDLLQHLGFAGFYRAFLLADVDQHAQLSLGYRRQVKPSLASQEFTEQSG